MTSRKRAPVDARFKQYSNYAEIRQMAYNIAAMQRERMLKSVAVLSFFHGEGKTLFCAALAKAYAQACGSRVLVVDTAQHQSAGAHVLGDCFSASEHGVEVTTLGNRKSYEAPPPEEAKTSGGGEESGLSTLPAVDNDFSMITKVASENSKQYGLILLDTSPLTAKNRNNVDPLLVARLASASILIVSQKLLDAPGLEDHMKTMEDSSLHLIGLINNEDFDS